MKDLSCLMSFYSFVFLLCFTSCANRQTKENDIKNDSIVEQDFIIDIDSVVYSSVFCSNKELMYDIHVITGQRAMDTIVGKFDGVHKDKVFIEMVDNDSLPQYFLVSKSGRLPKVELSGCPEMKPLIYAEGDLDGNGTDDIGYLHTWVNSQWRYYFILTYVKDEWMYMFGNTDYLFTPEYFRWSGHEIAQPGPRKGLVKITWGAWPMQGDSLIKDTIVSPQFTRIE